MGVFRWSGPICCKGGDNTYYIGIDVHKKKCVSTIKGKTNKILRQAEFDNNVRGITEFVKMIRKEGYVPATAVCESTANYWIVVHDMLEDAGINTLLAHPHNTKIITETVYKNDKADSAKLADLCRLRVQDPGQGSCKTKIPENKTHCRIQGLGVLGELENPGRVSPPLHRRGAAQRPLPSPPPACRKRY